MVTGIYIFFFLIASKIFVQLEEGDRDKIKDGAHIRRTALRCAPRQMQRKLWCISVNECGRVGGMQSGASTCTKRAAALILNCIRWVRTSRTTRTTRRRRRRRIRREWKGERKSARAAGKRNELWTSCLSSSRFRIGAINNPSLFSITRFYYFVRGTN